MDVGACKSKVFKVSTFWWSIEFQSQRVKISHDRFWKDWHWMVTWPESIKELDLCRRCFDLSFLCWALFFSIFSFLCSSLAAQQLFPSKMKRKFQFNINPINWETFYCTTISHHSILIWLKCAVLEIKLSNNRPANKLNSKVYSFA